MIGLLGLVPSGVKMAFLGALAAAVVLFAVHYLSLRGQRDAALAQVGALQTANQVQQQTIADFQDAVADWEAQAEQFQAALAEEADNRREAESHARDLERKLARHDLAALAQARPDSIERVINSAGDCVGRMLEFATGGRADDPDCDIPARR